MKHLTILFLLLISINISAQNNPDSLAIIDVLKQTYEALGNHDAEKYAHLCTEDYLLVENGEFIWNLDQETEYLRKNQEVKITRKDSFEIHSLKLIGDVAYVVFDLWSEMKKGEKTRNSHWIESSVLRKENKEWKVALIHSTVSKN